MQLTKIGKYELLKRLGRGTSADVYLAKDTLIRRNVALKVVEPETSDLEPFFNEARLLCRLQHPNIVTINGSEAIDGKVIVDMEYVPGVSLRQLIQKEGRLPVKQALKITAQLLNALNYAHNIGVIHRDVKPANILIGKNDLVKVVDFGIADVLGTQGYLAGAGTFSHMAPECFLEDKSDRRSDLYSVGAILYEMLTGKLPLNAERNTVYVWKEMLDRQEKPKPLTDFLSDIPNGLQGIVSLALNYDKQKRFQGAKDFLDALKRNNLYLLPNSEEELREIDGFEAIYNRIDKHLREELRADRKMGFAEVVRQYAQQHPEWQSKEDLLSLGQVRNNLRHDLLDANQYRPMPAAADMERLVNIAEHFGLNPEKLEQAENKRADLDALKAELKKPDHKSQQQHNPVLPATSAPLETEENKETPDQKTRTQEIPNYQPSKPKVQTSTAKATPPPIKEEQTEQKSKPKSSASTPSPINKKPRHTLGEIMAYTKKMGADSPGLIVFVLDQSGSMGVDWPGSQLPQPVSKAEAVADILNSAIREIGGRSVKGNDISPRCDIALIGYEGSHVLSQWSGALAGKDIVSIKDIIPNPLGEDDVQDEIPDGRGGLVEVVKKVKYWLEPKSGGLTPMGRAMAEARRMVEQWLSEPSHQRSFPPVVIHVTDGAPDDENGKQYALKEAEAIRQLCTDDGNVLLISLHLPEKISYSMAFPVSTADLPPSDEPANLLFAMSSIIPDEMLESAQGSQLPVKKGCKLMISNGNALIVTKLIQWGSTRGLDSMGAKD